ncbi:MAG: phosphoribosylamine--glycine ligase [Gammaproteobacteria bacterium]|nr:phosphoribosylamine--glycine ligase [Gammaproteobacteria bacterium]
MNVLVVGNGGREHAIVWKLGQSAKVDTVFVAPGNAGTAGEPRTVNVDIKVDAIDRLVDFAKNNGVGLTVIGPEVPLVAGIVDAFEAADLRCFGPNKLAAQLEGSKEFAKAFLERHQIPTATYKSFDNFDEARAHIEAEGAPIVVKADGLAAGKGVIVAATVAEALDAAEQMLSGSAFGDAGARIVVESFLEGEEARFIAVVDGEDILPLATSQDHKARDEGDTGPNTGGMGAYSPAPIVDEAMHERLMREVMIPTVKGLSAEGTPFTGFLYAGVMIAPDGTPRVLEFNCRCGDPETQPIMLRLRSDLVDILEAALDGTLANCEVEWDERAAVGVVLASGGYPGDYRSGDIISGLDSDFADSKVFHAGTALADGNVVTAGGRVLCACALGNTVTDAQHAAYARVEEIRWEEMYYRRDIGYRAVAREK